MISLIYTPERSGSEKIIKRRKEVEGNDGNRQK
jgi:hypothetical protein